MPVEIPIPVLIATVHNDPHIKFTLAKHQTDYFAGISINPKTNKAIIDWDEFADELKQSDEDVEEMVNGLKKEKDFDKMLREAEESAGI